MAHPLLAFVSIILLAGGMLFQFFIILSGTTLSTPENQIWFLESTTNNIPNAPRNPSRWTSFAICGVDSKGHNTNCGAPVPALPFDPSHHTNFGTNTGVPNAFVGTHTYYYLSRFAFAFFIIALFFAVCALLTSVLALCTRVGAWLSGFNTFVALFFQTLAAALMTAWSVKARYHLRRAGEDAKLGTSAYGFTWAAAACFLLATFTFCASGRSSHRRERTAVASPPPVGTRRRRGFFRFGRRRHVDKEYV
ncbi:SUR7-domain-containing protein [Trichodelitschia bisporula]|uniref:SUR7-domain-containing protein n=1 Tax=Trichodelitschia bisporula TaxID=703511 RepID=A0A6G1HN72_9PEZI|nr:SUR7-domain-containing protein [Trichodelitschia bisporula]